MTRIAKQFFCFFVYLGLLLAIASYVHAAAEDAASPGFVSAPATPSSGHDSAAPDVAAPVPGKRELCASGPAPKVEDSVDLGSLDAETRVDLQCLRSSYPQITGLASDAEGLWLLLGDRGRVLYGRYAPAKSIAGGQNMAEVWDVDVRTSMADPYPLEPERPDTPYGVSPGRKRSYDFLVALYGGTPAQVNKQLVPARLVGQPLRLSSPAGMALAATDVVLVEAVRNDPQLRAFLKMEGGFMWRRIAGESRLSPHAFGIAIDLSSRLAPYWRWSKLRPHPLQFSYPPAIVDAFEQAGFIWGGKWHEYDIMHFEYRPELVCKARALRHKFAR
ncbi:MAG: M15 family metallopeptidase [Desulfovibrio sp.]|nr:M15 family metallopeptidase [Desulfovibrio sp.]